LRGRPCRGPCFRASETMTDPTSDPTAPAGDRYPAADAYASPPPAYPAPAYPATEPGGAAAPDLAPVPAPVAPVTRSGGYGGPRVPAALLLVLAPVLAVAMFAGGVFVERSGALGAPVATPAPTGAPSADADKELGLIDEAWKDIQGNYVDAKDLDNQKLAYAAIRAMTEAVGDEGHTEFMTAEESKAVDQSLSGQFVGIGVQVAANDAGDAVTISNVFPNTPAEAAGLQRGDQIKAVDGKTTKGESLDETVSRVRGPEGKDVTLTIGRQGKADFDVTITRRQYDLPLSSWAMVPGTKTAMIRLEQFATGATDAIKKDIQDAKAAGATSIVLDLRANPGGFVSEAVGVASQFVGDGVVYQAFERDGQSKDAEVQPGGLATDIPLVVLANGNTASSAEIVTGAIQDAKRGKVVGEKTFGTGTVLGRFDLSDGSSLRIGVERWLTRNGRPIWHEGLDPDVKVDVPEDTELVVPDTLHDMTAAELAKSPDAQLRKAVELLSKGS
jgi:carboxyl-terminal processing protease